MARRVRGFVKVNDAGADERFEIALERSTSYWDWSKVTGADEELVVVLEE